MYVQVEFEIQSAGTALPSEALDFASRTYVSVADALEQRIQEDAALAMPCWRNFQLARARAVFEPSLHSFSVRFELQFPAFKINLTPLTPLRVDPTHLASNAVGNCGAKNDAIESGVLSLDAVRRLLILPSSAITPSKHALVGVWLRNVPTLGHPDILAAAVWFLCSRSIRRTLIAEHTCLLMLLPPHAIATQSAQFFELKLVLEQPMIRIVEYNHSCGILLGECAHNRDLQIDMAPRPLRHQAAISAFASTLVCTAPKCIVGDVTNGQPIVSLPLPSIVMPPRLCVATCMVLDAASHPCVKASELFKAERRCFDSQRRLNFHTRLNGIRKFLTATAKNSAFDVRDRSAHEEDASMSITSFAAPTSVEAPQQVQLSRFHSSFFSVTAPSTYLPFLRHPNIVSDVSTQMSHTTVTTAVAAIFAPTLGVSDARAMQTRDVDMLHGNSYTNVMSSNTLAVCTSLRALSRWTRETFLGVPDDEEYEVKCGDVDQLRTTSGVSVEQKLPPWPMLPSSAYGDDDDDDYDDGDGDDRGFVGFRNEDEDDADDLKRLKWLRALQLVQPATRVAEALAMQAALVPSESYQVRRIVPHDHSDYSDNFESDDEFAESTRRIEHKNVAMVAIPASATVIPAEH